MYNLYITIIFFLVVITNVTCDASVITTVAGTGISGYSGDNGPATSAELNFNYRVYVASNGDVYIADTYNHCIRRVDFSTQIITTVAGTGNPGYIGDNGPATSAELNTPFGVSVASNGDLYIADGINFVIRRVDFLTGIITTVAGTGINAYSGDNGPATSAELKLPTDVSVASNGDLYIPDLNSNVIRRVDFSTGIITTVAGTGNAGYSGDNGPATSAELQNPQGVSVASNGDLYIADNSNNVIRRVDFSTGIITTVAGTGNSGYSGDNGPATSAEFNAASGVSVASNGDLYIADANNNVIRRVDFSTGIITTVAGTGNYGYSGDNGPATSAELAYPYGVSVASNGDIYIADVENNRIRKFFALTATPTAEPTTTPTAEPTTQKVVSKSKSESKLNFAVGFGLGLCLLAVGALYYYYINKNRKKENDSDDKRNTNKEIEFLKVDVSEGAGEKGI